MGRGKGNMVYKIHILKRGSVLLEINSFNHYKVFKALNAAAIKLPFKTHIIYKFFK